MGKSCEDCAHCIVCGYDPRKEVMTISYVCDVDRTHCAPWRVSGCPTWELGDPWERAKRDWEERYGR